MGARKNVSASEVRAFLLSDEGQAALSAADVTTTVGTRGRLNPAQVAVFRKANPNRTYAEGVAEVGTVTVKVPTANSKGVISRRARTLPAPEAREYARALGLSSPVSRGRLSDEALDAVGIALAFS